LHQTARFQYLFPKVPHTDTFAILGYLALQIRQQLKQPQSTTTIAVQDYQLQNHYNLNSNEELVSILMRGNDDLMTELFLLLGVSSGGKITKYW
jgi:hypothetical protein